MITNKFKSNNQKKTKGLYISFKNGDAANFILLLELEIQKTFLWP